MILQDLFKRCRVEDIIKSKQLHISKEDKITEEELLDVYTFQVNKFCNIKPEENKDGCVILGAWYTDFVDEDYTEDSDATILDVCMYQRDDLVKAIPIYEAIEALPPLEEISDEDIEGRVKDLPEGRPYGYAFEFSKWSRVLGWDVDEGNVQRCGEADFLAAVLEEMTFNGFFEDSQEERRKELEERVEEAHRLMALPKEEQNKHLVSAEDTIKELHEELELEYKPRPEEEKRLFQIRSARGIYKNAKKTADLILGYLDGNLSIDEYIASFKKGDLIHPKEVKDLMHVSISDAYVLLDTRSDLTAILEIFCTHCGKFTGITYDSFTEVPYEMKCPLCGEKLEDPLVENSFVVYRKE